MRVLHLLMVGSLPETAHFTAHSVMRARHEKSKESNLPPTSIVEVPLVDDDELGPRKQTSPEVAKIGSKFMRFTQEDLMEAVAKDLPGFIRELRSAGASLVGQDETPGDGS